MNGWNVAGDITAVAAVGGVCVIYAYKTLKHVFGSPKKKIKLVETPPKSAPKRNDDVLTKRRGLKLVKKPSP